MRITAVLAAFVAAASAQSARWTHTYNGPGGQWDQAWQVRCGPDSGIYVCGDGQANSIPLTFEMTALGLTNSGTRRWAYRFTGPGTRLGQAYDLAVAPDHNLVLGGTTFDIVTANDFAVLGVSDSGTLRWQYRIADSGIGICRAVVCDDSGNAYACGTTADYGDPTAACIAPDGTERWLRTSDWPGEAMAIAVDGNGTAYSVGYLCPAGSPQRFAVCKFWPTGSSYHALPGSSRDTAVAVAVGGDGHIYVAGHMDRGATGADIAVMPFDTAGMARGWVYFYDHARQMDQARAILYGPDRNIYVAGFSVLSDSGGTGFVVLSLTSGGQFRWAYVDTGGRAAALNMCGDLAADEAGNIYACGMLAGTETTHTDAAIVSLTSGGSVRWKYLYARPDTGMDYFGSIACGPDGNPYACGTTGDPPAAADWIIVSLSSSGAVLEERHSPIAVRQQPSIVREIRASGAGRMESGVFDVSGRRVNAGGRLAPGVYLVGEPHSCLRRVVLVR